MRRILFVLTGVMMLLGGCRKSENPVVSGEPLHLIPLKVGNAWEYQVTAFDSSGKQSSRFMDEIFFKGWTLATS